MRITVEPGLEAVVYLLEGGDLPTSDLRAEDMRNFFGAWDEGRVCGVIGVEVLEDCALIRSLAVESSSRCKGFGARLLESAEAHAKDRGALSAYLLTTTATVYFLNHGYKPVEREVAPVAIRRTAEFRDLCPDSALLMYKSLDGARSAIPGSG